MDPRPALLQLLDPSDLAGQLVLEQPLPLRYRSGRAGTLNLRLTNLSSVTWPAFSDYGLLQVSGVYRWWSADRILKGEGGFIPLPRNLGTGESISVRARIEPPKRPGAYELQIIVLQVLDVGSGTGGNATVRVPAEIR
jgi:hypothetical protein